MRNSVYLPFVALTGLNVHASSDYRLMHVRGSGRRWWNVRELREKAGKRFSECQFVG